MTGYHRLSSPKERQRALPSGDGKKIFPLRSGNKGRHHPPTSGRSHRSGAGRVRPKWQTPRNGCLTGECSKSLALSWDGLLIRWKAEQPCAFTGLLHRRWGLSPRPEDRYGFLRITGRTPGEDCRRSRQSRHGRRPDRTPQRSDCRRSGTGP